MSVKHPLLRPRDGHHAPVTNEELFFDLVYVFAVTQLSHYLLHHLSLVGLVQTVILWFAVWLGWQYTCWVTNWFNPERAPVCILMFCLMLAAMFLAASIPDAFEGRALVFALAYVCIQVGRSLYAVLVLHRSHPLSLNFRRMLCWLILSGVFWIAGALVGPAWRPYAWLVAVVLEYIAPMTGFAWPGLGRSRTRDWTIDGGHLAERCQLFVIVALGESLLESGASLSESTLWQPSILSALLATFLTALTMWWLYFGTSAKDATKVISHSDDPGRIGAYMNYVHAILVMGIIATAVGNELALEHPHRAGSVTDVLALVGGPVVYLLGSVLYKRVVYGCVAVSHLIGALILLSAFVSVPHLDLLALSWLITLVMALVGAYESRIYRKVVVHSEAVTGHQS